MGFPNFFGLAGVALVVFALTGPLAYCEIETTRSVSTLQMACLKDKGTWQGPRWGCRFPETDNTR